MKEEYDSRISRTLENISLQESTRAANVSQIIEDGQTSPGSTYESFSWLFNYYKMFLLRLFKDLYQTVENYFYNDHQLPDHILNLINAHKQLQIEQLSENSFNVYFPSYPDPPRSLHIGSDLSLDSNQAQNPVIMEAIEFLHEDKDLLIAAEIGNDKLLEIYIRRGTDIQQVDHVGRNALHLAVYSGNIKAIKLLLDAGINPNVKDNVGMTPLSLSLMRRPSLLVANLLFDHGAILLPRSDPLDTGLFIQFAMMCKPTLEEEKILRFLVIKGAVINDPKAPGGRQALHFAAMSNNTSLIRLLVSLGADINMTNHRNETPKETAETFKCKEAYKILCEIEEMEEVASSSSNVI
ncbi:unnamed protein product, partial [Brenthis ino]